MLSAPPATATSTSPKIMDWAALTMACNPEPQSRLTLNALDALAQPPFSAATRDKYMSAGSVLITWPKTT
ncbi:hypothetical protein D9M72_568280 [compost metagenome]